MTPYSANSISLAICDGLTHLRQADRVISQLIDEVGPYVVRDPVDPYEALVRTIMFQQLTGQAATTILNRLLALTGSPGRYPTAAELLATSDDEFRSAGVSRQKASYLRDLADSIERGLIDFNSLPEVSDADVIDRLTAVKGVGLWTAQMFLMFQLQRLDVLPVGDVGVRRGMEIAYGLGGPPSTQQALTLGEVWAPYRTIGSWYMWRAVEIIPPA